MRVVFRADASEAVGTGHVMRCLTLARELGARGAEITFASAGGHSAIHDRIRESGFAVLALPQETRSGDGPASSEWGSDRQLEDARLTAAGSAGRTADWVVVDHYALGATWERCIRANATRVLAIDDLGRAHDSDVLLDQNWFGPDTETRYAGRVTRECRLLLGPRYALLTPEYAQLRRVMPPRDGVVRRILVSFGGGDSAAITETAIEVLSFPEFAELAVDVVVGALSASLERIEGRIAARPRTTLHRNLPSLAGIVARADLAIAAGGSSTWERLALGLPSLVVTLAANQEPIVGALARDGYVRAAGASRDVTPAQLRSALNDAIGQSRALALKPPIVDALGARRVAEVMHATALDRFSVRRATAADEGLFFDWRNDPATRAASFTTDEVPWESHRRWFAGSLTNGARTLLVGDLDGLPVGQCRLDREGRAATISYSVDQAFRGRGLGTRLVASAVDWAARTGARTVRAETRRENAASIQIFRQLGFTEDVHDGRSTFERSVA